MSDEYLIAVATGKSRIGLDRALTKVDFGELFMATRCGDEGFPKPHPEMLHILINDLGVTAERTLMVGDTTHDLQLAKNAGAQSIGVTYGAHDRSKLESLSPMACVDSFGDLLKWIVKNG